MRTFRYWLWLMLLPCIGLAQDFKRAEYFFDLDPGPGNGTTITLSPTASPLTFTTSIPTTSLSPGFHHLGMRVKQTDDTWSIFESRGFYISTATAASASITGAEYFLDIDPGAGSGTAITIPAGDISNFTLAVPTASLSPGFHFLAIRTKGTDKRWGIFESRGFYVSSATTNASDIVAAEYFFDIDPGHGSGIAIPVTSGSTTNFTVSLPTPSLAPGFHFLAIRTKGSDGKWGIFEARGFYVSSETVDASNIVKAEYFFDKDPGVGNGLPISAPSGSTSNFTVSLPVTSLTRGFHFLAIRTKGADGQWGLFESRGFYVSDQTTTGNIVAAEYFIDTDPGIGLASALVVNPQASIITQNFKIPIPSSVPEGEHVIGIRVLDSEGQWSVEQLDTIQVLVNKIPPIADAGDDQTISLPLSTVTVEATASTDPDGTIVSFSWKQINGPSTAIILNADQASTKILDLAEGVYQFELTVLDDVDLSDKDTVRITVNKEGVIVNPPPVDCVVPFITQIGGLLICNPPSDTYQWYFGNTLLEGATSQVLEIGATDFGQYRVETTYDTCERSSEVFDYLITDSENNQHDFFVVPNPVSEILKITNQRTVTVPVKVIDALGKVVFASQVEPGEHEFDFASVSSGQYYLIGESSSKQVLIKIHKR